MLTHASYKSSLGPLTAIVHTSINIWVYFGRLFGTDLCHSQLENNIGFLSAPQSPGCLSVSTRVYHPAHEVRNVKNGRVCQRASTAQLPLSISPLRMLRVQALIFALSDHAWGGLVAIYIWPYGPGFPRCLVLTRQYGCHGGVSEILLTVKKKPMR